jgi:hypothetical protein
LGDSCYQASLGFGRAVFRYIRSHLPDEEFLQDVRSGGCANPNQRVFKRQPRSLTVFRRIVKIGDASCGKVSEDARVVGLPVSVVALANHGVGQRVQNPGSLATASLVEITRILLQERRQDGASDERTGNKVGIGGTEALGVALGSLPYPLKLLAAC